MLRLAIALFILSLSIHSHSAPISADCVTRIDVSQNAAHNQALCSTANGKDITAMKASDISEGDASTQLHLSKRQPSLAESLTAMFFIPGLILLWVSRFAKSSK